MDVAGGDRTRVLHRPKPAEIHTAALPLSYSNDDCYLLHFIKTKPTSSNNSVPGTGTELELSVGGKYGVTGMQGDTTIPPVQGL